MFPALKSVFAYIIIHELCYDGSERSIYLSHDIIYRSIT